LWSKPPFFLSGQPGCCFFPSFCLDPGCNQREASFPKVLFLVRFPLWQSIGSYRRGFFISFGRGIRSIHIALALSPRSFLPPLFYETGALKGSPHRGSSSLFAVFVKSRLLLRVVTPGANWRFPLSRLGYRMFLRPLNFRDFFSVFLPLDFRPAWAVRFSLFLYATKPFFCPHRREWNLLLFAGFSITN